MEGQATDILQSKLGLKMELENLQKKAMEEKPVIITEDNSLELAKVDMNYGLLRWSCYFKVYFCLVEPRGPGGEKGVSCRKRTF